jgi:hypothetical protein
MTPEHIAELERRMREDDGTRILAAAADTIDKLLRDDATQRGGTATHGLRQLIIPPLIADFSVEENDRMVTIWSIRHIGELANGH